MSTRRRSRRNYLNESLDELLEMNIFEEDKAAEKEAGEEEDEGMDMSDMLQQASEMSLGDLVQKALDPEGSESSDDSADLDLDLELEPEEDSEEDDEGADESNEGQNYELDELDELEELDEMEVEIDEIDEGPGCESDDPKQESSYAKGDLFLEIDENMLKNEITKMRRLREGEASEMASHFGGGDLDKEMFVDVDEGDLNVHSGNLGREGVPMPKVEAALRKTMRKNRMLESKVQEYQDAVRGMKTQLTEMNLFNAKLLYANKLMQNRELSLKQQRHIVESLDEASTLNEAKLLFESLSKSLMKPASKGRNLSESANRRTLGSSSRPVRSGSAKPMNESVALDRWATLAGIKK